MEILRTSISGVTYRGKTFQNITSQLKQNNVPEADMKVVSSLLKFTGNKNEDTAFRRFLNSLQVCKKGHYRRFDLIKPVELWA